MIVYEKRCGRERMYTDLRVDRKLVLNRERAQTRAAAMNMSVPAFVLLAILGCTVRKEQKGGK